MDWAWEQALQPGQLFFHRVWRLKDERWLFQVRDSVHSALAIQFFGISIYFIIYSQLAHFRLGDLLPFTVNQDLQ